jgi:hypothetical protein
MDWANERYVRIYQRDTRTTRLAGWEGRALLWEIIRKSDRAGLMENVRTAEDVALMVDIPIEVVRRALDRLVSLGAVEIGPLGLVVPNYIPAQETPQSDKQRQRNSRDARAAKARSARVTKRDCIESQNVTKPPNSVTGPPGAVTKTAENVTPSLAVPSLAVPSQKNESRVEDSTRWPELEIFDFWANEMGHPRAKLDKNRRARIRSLLHDGLTVEDLCNAIRGAKLDPFLMGQNDRGTVYDGLLSIFKNREKVERLIELYEKGPARTCGGTSRPGTGQSTQPSAPDEHDWERQSRALGKSPLPPDGAPEGDP